MPKTVHEPLLRFVVSEEDHDGVEVIVTVRLKNPSVQDKINRLQRVAARLQAVAEEELRNLGAHQPS